jgi:predicted DNA-binding WGR domain protein
MPNLPELGGPSQKIVLTRIRPEKNERRFYAVDISRDMFGQISVSRNWGRIGTSGRLRYDRYPNIHAAQQALYVIANSKRKRGYVHVESRPCAWQRPDDALLTNNSALKETTPRGGENQIDSSRGIRLKRFLFRASRHNAVLDFVRIRIKMSCFHVRLLARSWQLR